MPFLTQAQLESMHFKSLGREVLISDKASIYNPEQIEIGDFSRIDDFCIVSGRVSIGRNVHIAVFSNIAGGEASVTLEDFAGLAYGCHVFSQSDDYSGKTLTNPTVPDRYKNETKKPVVIGRHSIVGTQSIIFPGVTLAEGTSVGTNSTVTKSTEPWSIYFGNPAKYLKKRADDLLILEQKYIEEKQ